jgi:hypothetical protein
MADLKVLIACEESQVVCIEFRKLGIEAYSCDILPCSGGHPEWHIQGDVLSYLDEGWDMMLAFPPCTHLACSGAAWFEQKRKDGRQQDGINFFLAFTKTNISKWMIENPVGIMNKLYRKPDQVIQPYYFGDEAQKTTCLWLNSLPPLYHNSEPNLFDSKVTHVDKGEFIEFESGKRMQKWYALLRRDSDRGHIRSKTFPGIAKAMAEQWGNYLLNNHK